MIELKIKNLDKVTEHSEHKVFCVNYIVNGVENVDFALCEYYMVNKASVEIVNLRGNTVVFNLENLLELKEKKLIHVISFDGPLLLNELFIVNKREEFVKISDVGNAPVFSFHTVKPFLKKTGEEVIDENEVMLLLTTRTKGTAFKIKSFKMEDPIYCMKIFHAGGHTLIEDSPDGDYMEMRNFYVKDITGKQVVISKSKSIEKVKCYVVRSLASDNMKKMKDVLFTQYFEVDCDVKAIPKKDVLDCNRNLLVKVRPFHIETRELS